MKIKFIIFVLSLFVFNLQQSNAQNFEPEENWIQTNGTVRVIVVDTVDKSIYIGGDFTMVGDSVRNRIAKLDSNGQVTLWNPDANNTVFAIVVDGNTVYVGGDFTNIGSKSRYFIAALDAESDTAFLWNPVANNTVRTLLINNNIIYAGGNFTNIGGQLRNYLAAFSTSTGLINSWNPNANNYVHSLAYIDNMVYAGGAFFMIGGVLRANIAAMDPVSGNAFAVNIYANSSAKSFLQTGNILYVSGDFTSILSVQRNRVAAIDVTSNAVTSWNPNANNMVNAICAVDSLMILGGSFTNIGGQSRFCLASVNVNTGIVNSWNPNLNGNVLTMANYGNKLIVGGEFTTIGGQPRNKFAVFSRPPCTPTIDTEQITACDSFTWIDNITYYSDNNTATYLFTSKDGCDSLIELNLTITTIDTSITQTGITLKANQNGAGYQWLNCNNNFLPLSDETGQSFTPSSTGNYAVEIDNGICADTSTCYLIANIGFNDLAFNQTVKIYPNPTISEINIDVGYEYKSMEIIIKNTLGQIIDRKLFSKTSLMSFTLKGDKGVYFIQIKSDENQAVVYKVIKL